MRTPVLAAATSLLLATACGPSDEARAPEVSNDAAGPTPQEQLAALPEGQRNAVFIRAIRDADLDCQHVESSERAGEHQGMPVWTATCDGDRRWTIVVTEGGTAQILNPNESQVALDEPPGNAQDR